MIVDAFTAIRFHRYSDFIDQSDLTFVLDHFVPSVDYPIVKKKKKTYNSTREFDLFNVFVIF